MDLAAGWELVIVADRHYFDRVIAQEASTSRSDVAAARLALERGRAARRARPSGAEARRRAPRSRGRPTTRRCRGCTRCIARRADGSYAIEDVGSTNGTEVNGRALPSHDPVTLADGDRIQLGAWTTMTVRRLDGGAGEGMAA